QTDLAQRGLPLGLGIVVEPGLKRTEDRLRCMSAYCQYERKRELLNISSIELQQPCEFLVSASIEPRTALLLRGCLRKLLPTPASGTELRVRSNQCELLSSRGSLHDRAHLIH